MPLDEKQCEQSHNVMKIKMDDLIEGLQRQLLISELDLACINIKHVIC